MAGFVLPIISGLAGLFGGGKQQEQQTKSSGTSATNTNQTSTTSPNLSPFQQSLARMFTSGAQNLYNSSTNLTPYATQGQATIAGQGDANRQVISNMLAQHGMSFSPAAAAPLTQNLLNSGNQMSTFTNSLPLLQRQLQSSSLDQLMSAFKSLPTGTTTTGSGSSNTNSSQTGTTDLYGNPNAGLFSGIGAGLAAPVNGKTGESGIQSILKALGI